jgi:hypothetical protein
MTIPACTSDEVEAALKAHNDAIGRIVLDARPKIEQLRTLASDMDTTILTPLENILESIFSTVNLTLDDLVMLSGIQTGATKEEIEISLSDMGLPIVNGRVLVTRKGDVDLSVVRELYRLTGSFSSIQRLVPEVVPCFISGDMLEGSTPTASRFLLISTYQKITTTAGIGCKPDTQTIKEEVVGIDETISSVLLKNPQLTREELILYIFWLGKPQATPQLKARALSFGLTEEEYFNAVFRKNSPSYKVKVIDKPYDQLCVFSTVFGDDVDAILQRGFGTKGSTGTNSTNSTNSQKIKLQPTPQDVLDEIRSSGILTAKPGRTNNKGLVDYGTPAVQLLAVIDFEKSLNPEDKQCIDLDSDLSQIGNVLAAGMNTASEAINTLIKAAFDFVAKAINKLTKSLSLINGFLLKLLHCLFPTGVSYDLQGESNPKTARIKDLVDKMFNLLQDGIAVFKAFFDLLGEFLNILAPLACLKASLPKSLLKPLSKLPILSEIPGLACLIAIPSLDSPCLDIGIDIGQLEADLAFAVLSSALVNLRSLFSFILTFTYNLPTAFSEKACLPLESAVLMVKLGVRATLLKLGIELPDKAVSYFDDDTRLVT